ncbi:alpha/beta fold hydrolase [Janthinobacterium fluminis]|uniref:Alpha/beta fold hydrolase n=1 Tax=Janthinobacterium fluminis TaxID=2987524 RepID=A0ABT5JWH2_9BURK|nr:alpha/beta fold hydrolase [Janthinobacterium fluminis]MDC8757082.1 alpha/beta fold hydrolase [Janthinobacterium fluminis]
MAAKRLTLNTDDGQTLAVYCHEPQQALRAEVVIAPGMAIPQSFYAEFAAYLAGQGCRVWTFDYRGMGESRQGSLRGCKADISDWVGRDCDAVVRHASMAPERTPLFLLGHSLGGQTAPLLPSIQRLAGIINIAVGSGTMRHNQPATRRLAPLLWHVLTPLLCPLFGYFPGARIGVIGDVPRGAMAQWRRWCLTPDYLLSGEPGARAAYARVRCPVLALTFSDDELLLESGSRMLHGAYSGAPVDYRELTPQQFDVPRIGHFGFFRRNQEKVLWPLVSDWLQQRCADMQPGLARLSEA